ncbi:hypothetical protein ACFXPI_16535 [Streptomyces sp. NPDC059104]|uniref:hypothetical protein n=1 Tax=Streptomyces sp. NPDC059104 TaxID=3346729 RepID=UPI00367B72BF
MRPWSTATERALRSLLNEWDPIGVADEVDDEYDCMLAPLLGRLYGGADRAGVDAFLRHELEDHFGISPALQRTDAVAGRVLDWWATARPAPGTTPRPLP